MPITKERIANLMMGKRPQTASISHQAPPNFIALAVFASTALLSVV